MAEEEGFEAPQLIDFMIFKELSPLTTPTFLTFRENFARNSHAEIFQIVYPVRQGEKGSDRSKPFRLRQVAGPEAVHRRLGYTANSVRTAPAHPR